MWRDCSCIEKRSFRGLQLLGPALRIAVFACMVSVGFGAMIAHAAPLNFSTTDISFTSPVATLTIASGSTADALTVNATSVVVSLSASGGNSFGLTSSDYDLSVATTSESAVAATLDCVGGQGKAGTASLSLKQVSGSATYTIAPTGAPCVVPIVTTGGITIYPIVIHAPSYASATVDDPIVVPIGATDPNGYPVSLSVSLPPDASFSTSTDDLSWRPRAAGPATVTILASDKVTRTTSTIRLEAFAPTSSGASSSVPGAGASSGARGISGSSTPSIAALRTEIAALEQEAQKLLAELKARGVSVSGPPPYAFTRDLTVGSRGDDVHALQVFLVQQDTGPAAHALEKNATTRYFGPLTRAALAEYQKSVGIRPAVGYFGPITRAYLKAHE